jgi:IMP dehydrogenase
MRTGAVGVLVGAGAAGTGTTRSVLGIGSPEATAIADAAGARTRHLEETGVYVQVIADATLRRGGDIAKAIACGADAVMLGEALARATDSAAPGAVWGTAAWHRTLPRGGVVPVASCGTIEEILVGPGREGDGELNLFGALRASMAMCGAATIREFQRSEIVVVPPGDGAERAGHSSR